MDDPWIKNKRELSLIAKMEAYALFFCFNRWQLLLEFFATIYHVSFLAVHFEDNGD